MEARQVFVTGGVQGVGFRMATIRAATGLALTGWTRNRSDGSVEVWAQGDRANLEKLIDFLRVGPPYVQVDNVRWTTVSADASVTGFGVAPSA